MRALLIDFATFDIEWKRQSQERHFPFNRGAKTNIRYSKIQSSDCNLNEI